MQYIMAPIGNNKSNFDRSPTYIAEQIRAKWPQAEVVMSEGGAMVSWMILMEEYPLIGDLWREKNQVVIDADQGHTADFAIWFRTLLSDDERVWIFDDLGNLEPYEIRPGATHEQVFQALF